MGIGHPRLVLPVLIGHRSVIQVARRSTQIGKAKCHDTSYQSIFVSGTVEKHHLHHSEMPSKAGRNRRLRHAKRWSD